MKLNSAQLEAFFTVAQQQNFTKAAEILHVTQSALSQRIAKLEEELETTLFIRDRTTIRLTEYGEQVLRYCQLSQNAESELLKNLKNDRTDLAGVLRIAGFSSVNNSLLIPALNSLMSDNPRLSIQLMTREMRDLEPLLRSAQADYIITNQLTESSHLECLLLGYEENVLVRSKKHKDQKIYLNHDENDPLTEMYFRKFKLKLDSLNMRYLDDVYGLIEGVRNGYGLAVLPLHLIENFKELEVIEPAKVLKTPVYLVYFVQPYYRKIHSFVLDALLDYFKKALSK